MESLPFEILLHISQYLSTEEIIMLSQINRYFHQTINQSDDFWRLIYRREISHQVTEHPRERYLQIMKDFSRIWKLYVRIDFMVDNDYTCLLTKFLDREENQSRDIYNYILIRASLIGRRNLIERMIKLGASYFNEAMISAARGGHLDIVKDMIVIGSNDFDKSMIISSREGHLDIVREMIKNGACEFNNAMDEACRGGHLNIVIELLDRGRGINDYRRFLRTSAHYGHLSIMREIVTRGVISFNELTPILQCAVRNNHHDVAHYLRSILALNLFV